MKLPQVLEKDIEGNKARFTLVAPAPLEYFDGHFPGFPVLPGVVQIGWSVALAGEAFGCELAVNGMRRIKFVRLIRPDTPVTLELELNDDATRLQFRYSDAEGDYSSGSLEVESAS